MPTVIIFLILQQNWHEQQAVEDLPSAPHVRHQGPGPGHEQLLPAVQVHSALAAEEGREQAWIGREAAVAELVRQRKVGEYSGDPNTGRVWYMNGPNKVGL